MSESVDALDRSRPLAREDTLVGAAVVALALLVGWLTWSTPANTVYARVGPSVFPWIITVLLLLLGLALVLEGLRGGWSAALDEPAIQWRQLGWLALGLLLNLALIKPAGFILASTALFALTARAFGSARILRDAPIGFALAALAYFGFDRLLGYRIGSGLVERFL